MMSHVKDPSVLGRSVLQSTFSDGHCFRPDFDISVIKGKRSKTHKIMLFCNCFFVLTCFNLCFEDRTVIENAAEPEKNPENEKEIVEMQTFLLAYLTAKV